MQRKHAISESKYWPTKQYYEQHRPKLLRLAETIVGSSTIAEDIVNEAFILFATKLEEGTRELTTGYLVRIVRNLAIEHKRKQRREEKIMSPYDEAQNVDEVVSFEVDPEEIVLWRDQKRAFFEALDELPPLTGRVVRMHLVDELKIREIAERLKISVGKTHRAMRDGLVHCAEKLRSD